MREGIVTRAFDANVETSPERHGARPREIPFESREEFAEGALAAKQKAMDVSRLRRPGPIGGLRRQSIAFQNNDLFEAVGECRRGCEPGYSRADHDGSLADQS